MIQENGFVDAKAPGSAIGFVGLDVHYARFNSRRRIQSKALN